MGPLICWEYAVAGAIGGLVGNLAKCGYLELPSLRDGKLYLGGFTGIFLGVVSGMIGDTNWINALMWGAGGTTIIEGLVRAVEKIPPIGPMK